MHSHVLSDLVVVFGAALLVSAVSHRLRIPSLVGFLLTGALVGPYGLALVADQAAVEAFAELGVVFLLFIIGLEFSLAELRRVGRLFAVGGSLQSVLTIAAGAVAARLLGAAWPLALFVGFVVALSSTAIVLKLYEERRELDAPHGRLGLGILLFQDLLIVPMLIVVPVLAGRETLTAPQVALRFLEGLLVIVAVLAAGRFLIPRLLELLVRTRVRELMVLGALFASLGTGLLTQNLGLSMALGSFLAGVALADSDYRFQVQSEIASFRDVFNSLFFTTIGMLLSLPFVVENGAQVAGVTLAILGLKAVVIFAVARLLRFPSRTALCAALGLCQIGEFSFVLLRAGNSQGLLTGELYPLLIAASVLSLLVSPGLIALAPRLAGWKQRRDGTTVADEKEAEATPPVQVVVAGYGLNSRHLVRVLAEAGIPHRVIEANGALIGRERPTGVPLLFGDASRRDILLASGIETARLGVFAMSDPQAMCQAVHQARALNPKLHIVARSHRVDEIDQLLRVGANEVVAQELETSIELATRVLERLRLPDSLVRAAARGLRRDQYRALRSQNQRTGLSETLLKVLAAGTVEGYALGPEHPAEGRSIRDLALRKTTGATILGILRNDQILANPDPDLELRPGDALVLVGNHAAITEALDYLDHLERQGTPAGSGLAQLSP